MLRPGRFLLAEVSTIRCTSGSLIVAVDLRASVIGTSTLANGRRYKPRSAWAFRSRPGLRPAPRWWREWYAQCRPASGRPDDAGQQAMGRGIRRGFVPEPLAINLPDWNSHHRHRRRHHGRINHRRLNRRTFLAAGPTALTTPASRSDHQIMRTAIFGLSPASPRLLRSVSSALSHLAFQIWRSSAHQPPNMSIARIAGERSRVSLEDQPTLSRREV